MRQRGFSVVEVAIALGAAAALAAVVFGGIHMWNNHMDDVRKEADTAGYNRALKETAQRDKTELIDAQSQIAAFELEKSRVAEAHAKEQADAKRKHDKEMADEQVKTAALQHSIDVGDLVLWDNGWRGAGASCAGLVYPAGACGGLQAGGAAAAAGGSGQAFSVRLSAAFSSAELAEYARADEVAKDLELCWGIARDDRARLAAPPGGGDVRQFPDN